MKFLILALLTIFLTTPADAAVNQAQKKTNTIQKKSSSKKDLTNRRLLCYNIAYENGLKCMIDHCFAADSFGNQGRICILLVIMVLP